MTLLYTISFPIIFPIQVMTHCFVLFFLLFSIMTGCLHPENGNVQTVILDPFTEEWLISVNEECPLNCSDWQDGKQPDGALQSRYYFTHCFFYYMHYVFTPDQDYVRWNHVLRTAYLCTLILCVTTSLWNIGENAMAVGPGSAETVQRICFFLHYTIDHYYCN